MLYPNLVVQCCRAAKRGETNERPVYDTSHPDVEGTDFTNSLIGIEQVPYLGK